jgi:hypothetical protein
MFQQWYQDRWSSRPSKRDHQPLAVLIVRRSSFCRHQVNTLHIIMARKAGVPVIPFDLDVSRIILGDRAAIRLVAVKANPCAGLEFL